MTRRARSRDELLGHPRWLVFAERGVDLQGFDRAELRCADAFYAYLERRRCADPRTEDFLDWDRSRKSANRLRTLLRALRHLLGRHVILMRLEKAAQTKGLAYRQAQTGARPRLLGRSPKFAVPRSELPASWLEVLAALDAGEACGGVPAPAPSIVARMAMKLRQLIRSARNTGLPDELSVETARAYLADLERRKVRPATLRAGFEELERFARCAGMSEELVAKLRFTRNACNAREKLTPALKHEKIHAIGSTLDVLDAAEARLAEAAREPQRQRGRALENGAAALALLAVLPVRLADTQLRFGEHVHWDAEGYSLSTRLSKGDQPYETRLDRRLDKYLDALVLRGADSAYRDDMRQDCLASHRALFLNEAGKPAGAGYVSDLWRRHVRTGAHISRSLMHAQVDTRLAMLVCGQRSERTASAYQGDKYAARALAVTQTSIAATIADLGLPDDDDDGFL